LVVKIPWNNLKGQPVQIIINDLHLLATPKQEVEYDPVLQDELDQKRKQDMLASMDLLNIKTKDASTGTVCVVYASLD
jgi:vacuolar protein sorting-associated protein 13A/C